MKEKGIDKYYILFLLIILLNACQTKIPDKLVNLIESKGKVEKDSVIISMNEVTDFKWDEMFVFAGSYSPEEISKILGHQYNEEVLTSDGLELIFLKEGEIVYTEFSENKNSEIIQFNKIHSDTLSVPHYFSDKDRFYVLYQPTYKGSNKYFYNLIPFN